MNTFQEKYSIDTGFLAPFLAIFILGTVIQLHLFISWDVGWHWLAAERLMKGGTYTQDFFDMNPPMILYLLIPPILVQHLTNLNLIFVFRAYVFIVSTISLWACFLLIHRLFDEHDKIIQKIFFLSIALVFILLPAYELGQRDPFLITLIMPYLLATSVRAKNSKLSRPFALWIGFLAGLGFSLNLQFLILFFFLEIYLFFQRISFTRPETISLLSIVILYLLSIFTFFRDYVTQVLPVVFFLYTDTFNYSWKAIFSASPFAAWLTTFIFLFIEWKNTRYRSLMIVLFASTSVSALLFLLTRKLW